MKAVKRTIIQENQIYFPVGQLHEDLAWNFDLIPHIHHYAVYSDVFYQYLAKRKGSTTFTMSINCFVDMLVILINKIDLLADIRAKNPLLLEGSILYIIGHILSVKNTMKEIPIHVQNQLQPIIQLLENKFKRTCEELHVNIVYDFK